METPKTNKDILKEIINNEFPLFEYETNKGQHVTIFANGKIEGVEGVKFLYNYFYIFTMALLSPIDGSNESKAGLPSNS